MPYIRDRVPGQEVPKSEVIAKRLFCIPMHPRMSQHDNEYICAAVSKAVQRIREGDTTYLAAEESAATKAITGRAG